MVGRPLDETELVERAKRGDEHAYGELVHAYQGIAFRIAYLVVGNAAEAEDAAQDGFVKAGDLTVQLTWSGLGKAFCFALPPELSASGKHHMPSTFVPCTEAAVTVNGNTLPGKPVPREMAGQKISTAFLAFSETWIRA